VLLRRLPYRGVGVVEQGLPLRGGERLPLPGGAFTELGVLVPGHGAVEGQRDLLGGIELPDNLVRGERAVFAPVSGGQEGDEDVVRQWSDPSRSEMGRGAAGEPPADDPRRVCRQGGESCGVDVPVLRERAADHSVRVFQGRVDDGVGQVTIRAHQQAGLTGR
jgi:hypothetical protein